MRATNDTGEIGGNQPDLRVSASLNADSAHIGVTRHNGITRAQSSPQGGGPIMGQSAIVRLTGETWEEMLTIDRDMLHIRFPSTSNTAKDKKEGDSLKDLRHMLADARDYGRLRWEHAEKGGLNLLLLTGRYLPVARLYSRRQVGLQFGLPPLHF